MGLAQFVPQIVKWIGGDKAGTAAQKVVDIAQQAALVEAKVAARLIDRQRVYGVGGVVLLS